MHIILKYLQQLRLSTAPFKRLLVFNSSKIKMETESVSTTSGKSSLQKSLKFKPVTHVIFDLDGLLLDTEVIYKNVISQIVKSYGKEYSQAIRLKVLGTPEQATAQIVIEECKLPITVDDFLDQFRAMRGYDLSSAKLMDGAERLIQHLKCNNIPMAVATSSADKAVTIKIKNYKDLFQLFSHIVCGGTDPDVKQGKPAPDIFLICAKRFKDHPKPEKCLVFEDAPNGVVAGVTAGMQVVMVPEADLPPDKTAEATTVLKTLSDFKPEEFGLPAFKDE